MEFTTLTVPIPSCESHLSLFKSPSAFQETLLRTQNHEAKTNHSCYALSKVPTHRIHEYNKMDFYTPLPFEVACFGSKSNWNKWQSKKIEKPVSLNGNTEWLN